MDGLLRQLTYFCIAIVFSTHSLGVTFFGEDLNSTDDPSTIADDPVRIAHPNADGARTAFLALLSGVSTQNFESLASGATTPISVAFGATTATITGNGTVTDVPTGTFNGTYPISGTKFLLSSAGGGGTLTVAFDSPQVAFGFYATDIGDGSGQLTVTLNFAAGGSTTLTVPHSVPSGSGSVLYFGVVDSANPFTSVVFGNSTSSSDGFGFDDFTIGNAAQVVSSTLQFSSATYSGAENAGSVVITVTRTGSGVGSAGVTFATSNGTATAGSDYTATTGTLAWVSGDTSAKSFTVSIIDDALVEGNETVNLTLSTPTGGATLGAPPAAVLTIVDDDSAVPAVTTRAIPTLSEYALAGLTMLLAGMAALSLRRRRSH